MSQVSINNELLLKATSDQIYQSGHFTEVTTFTQLTNFTLVAILDVRVSGQVKNLF